MRGDEAGASGDQRLGHEGQRIRARAALRARERDCRLPAIDQAGRPGDGFAGAAHDESHPLALELRGRVETLHLRSDARSDLRPESEARVVLTRSLTLPLSATNARPGTFAIPEPLLAATSLTVPSEISLWSEF